MTPQEFAQMMHGNQGLAIGPHGDQAHDLLQPDPIRPTYIMTSNKVPTEHEEQVALFQWAEASGIPELEMLHSTPMGGYRPPHIGAMLKAEGAKRGYPDISLDVPSPDGRWAGLRIELKIKGNKPTPEQVEWLERLNRYGYKAVCCYGCDEAIAAILDYLGIDA